MIGYCFFSESLKIPVSIFLGIISAIPNFNGNKLNFFTREDMYNPQKTNNIFDNIETISKIIFL